MKYALLPYLQQARFWLLAISGSLLVINLQLNWQTTKSFAQLTISLFFWFAAVALLWKKRHNLKLESDIFSTLLGIFLIAWVLFRNANLTSTDDILRYLSPFFSAIGVALLASGIRGIKQYWQALTTIFFLSLPILTSINLIEKIIGISLISAKLCNFVLWYLGFPVYRQGVIVILPKGAIEIYPGCSGIDIIILLLQLSIIFFFFFKGKIYQKILLPIAAIILSLLVNSVRLTLLALLVNFSNQATFDYWHGEDGAQIFCTISILLFGILCHFVIQQNSRKKDDSLELNSYDAP